MPPGAQWARLEVQLTGTGGVAQNIVVGFLVGAAGSYGITAGAVAGAVGNGAAAWMNGEGKLSIAVSSLFGAIGGAASGALDITDLWGGPEALKQAKELFLFGVNLGALTACFQEVLE